MPARNNPFKPTKPSSGSNFAGRISEISRIRTVLDETKNGNPTNLLVVGERGIGKTSLLLVSKDLATGEINLSEDPFDFLTICNTSLRCHIFFLVKRRYVSGLDVLP